MPKAKDLSGMVFSRLTVLHVSVKNNRKAWKCQCTCGKSTLAYASSLRRGDVQSCGCKHAEVLTLGSSQHFAAKERRRLHAAGCSLCKQCGMLLELSEFSKNSTCTNGVNSYCTWCASMNSRLCRYGLSTKEYWSLYDEQLGKCAICETAAGTDIDHDHNTGKVRALLCNSCNTALAHTRTPKILRNMATYLEKNACPSS